MRIWTASKNTDSKGRKCRQQGIARNPSDSIFFLTQESELEKQEDLTQTQEEKKDITW